MDFPHVGKLSLAPIQGASNVLAVLRVCINLLFVSVFLPKVTRKHVTSRLCANCCTGAVVRALAHRVFGVSCRVSEHHRADLQILPSSDLSLPAHG